VSPSGSAIAIHHRGVVNVHLVPLKRLAGIFIVEPDESKLVARKFKRAESRVFASSIEMSDVSSAAFRLVLFLDALAVLHLVAVLALAVFEAVVALAIVLALRVARALVIVVANLLALVVLLLVAVIAFAIIERIIAIAAVLALRVSRADEIIVALRLVFLAVVAAFPTTQKPSFLEQRPRFPSNFPLRTSHTSPRPLSSQSLSAGLLLLGELSMRLETSERRFAASAEKTAVETSRNVAESFILLVCVVY